MCHVFDHITGWTSFWWLYVWPSVMECREATEKVNENSNGRFTCLILEKFLMEFRDNICALRTVENALQKEKYPVIRLRVVEWLKSLGLFEKGDEFESYYCRAFDIILFGNVCHDSAEILLKDKLPQNWNLLCPGASKKHVDLDSFLMQMYHR